MHCTRPPTVRSLSIPAIFFIALITSLNAQDQVRMIEITGTVLQNVTGTPVSLAEVIHAATGEAALTDVDGNFSLNTTHAPEITLLIKKEDVELSKTYAPGPADNFNIGTVYIATRGRETDAQIYSLLLTDEDAGLEVGGENISGLLNATRDAFTAATAFVFGPARFRIRGYDSENDLLFLNGIPMNTLERGWVPWSAFGGLNDVMRNRETHIGIGMIPFNFGGIGGSSAIDLRASSQRKQTRFTYSRTNRNYRNRVMATWSTGMLPNGWAVSVSGSHRWSEEGYIDGTFYDGWSYFLSVDKKLSDQHLLNFVALGTPTKRGRNGAAVQEMYRIAESNYYNPYWGYQNGEKRNSRVAQVHQPLFMLRHDWTLRNNTTLSSTISYTTGRNGSTALDWYNANDPRPDYYRRLPSFIEDPELAEEVFERLSRNEALRQIQWDHFYEVNRNSMVTIEDANGIEGNQVSGRLSRYIVEDRRYDSDKFDFNTHIEHIASDWLSLYGGLTARIYNGDNYKRVDDLLGGEFYIDWDRFAERDFPDSEDVRQNDLNNPNRTLREGDRFGYSYQSTIQNYSAWAQAQFVLKKLDIQAGIMVSNTRFWRTGDFRNGRFPDNSLGDSEKFNFTNYGGKAGVTFKVDGRNYFYANGMYMTRAPFFRNAFVSPRTRNEAISGLKSETIFGTEAGYTLRSPYLKARVTGFYTRFLDQTVARSFYHDDLRTFVNFSMTDIDKEHMGVEGFVEATISPGLSVNAVASIGQYIYTSRPTAIVSQDNNAEVLREAQTVYARNFYVPGTPQSAYTLGLSYRSKDYWSLYFNLNLFDQVWIDFNPSRRTSDAVDLVEEDSDIWNRIINQERTPRAVTANVSFFKSWKIDLAKDPMFLNLSVSINNMLDNQDFITGGYEQLRFDFETRDVERFPARYYYFQGLNYYLNISLRF